MIVRALSEKHAVSVILGIYDSGEVKKMQIMDFGPSINTIDALLKTLADEGIISVREEMQGRRVFLISLTAKGRRVAAILDTVRKEFRDVQNLHGYKLYR
jgi:DNA-binding PadR family transcriptional regulator